MQVDLEWGVKIPMRDGVRLNATIYRPRESEGRAPCILLLTPYISDAYHRYGVTFASKGFQFAIVDVRGRGNSEGAFRPRIQEAQDGHDAVEWIAGQPWCDGNVAMWGGSYAGYAQWATAKEFPSHLRTIIPAAAPHVGLDVPMRNNIFRPSNVQWVVFTSGNAAQGQIVSDRSFWSAQYRRWHESGAAFRELDSMVGHPSATFQEWLSHPELDEYWDAHNPTSEQYSRIDLPILTITGSYDDDQPGALEHYKRHLAHGSSSARHKHYLVIGPWDHYGTTMPRAEFGGIKLGPASVLDLSRLQAEWYAWAFGRQDKPPFLKKNIAYYVMGAERWRYAKTLDDITAEHRTLFLDSDGQANDVVHAGVLGPVAGSGAPDTYRYDPAEKGSLEIEAEERADGHSLVDQTMTFAMVGKQLVYHSAPFSEDTEISGFFKLVAWIAIDCPDTDFYVSVHEIGLDGSSIRLSNDVMRARYRESLRAGKLVSTTEALEYNFDRFTFVSRMVPRGHRLRLVIAPMGRIVEASFIQKNFNGGGIVAEETAADARPVTVQLFHDTVRPSALHVPIGRKASADDVDAPDGYFARSS